MDNGKALSVPSEPLSMASVLDRALHDDSVSIDKLERLIALQERLAAKEASDAFAVALSLAQADMGTVFKDKDNSHTKSRYASYEAVDKVARPIYTRHGFAPSFTTDGVSETHLMVVCDLSHRGGHLRRYSLPIPLSTKGPKGNDLMTPTHASLSAFSYGKRGQLVGIFNIPISDGSDDDGNAAGGSTGLDAGQLQTIEDLIKKLPPVPGRNDTALFCQHFSIGAPDELLKKDYARAVEMLQTTRLDREAKAKK